MSTSLPKANHELDLESWIDCRKGIWYWVRKREEGSRSDTWGNFWSAGSIGPMGLKFSIHTADVSRSSPLASSTSYPGGPGYGGRFLHLKCSLPFSPSVPYTCICSSLKTHILLEESPARIQLLDLWLPQVKNVPWISFSPPASGIRFVANLWVMNSFEE